MNEMGSTTAEQAATPAPAASGDRRPFRVWPAVVLAILYWSWILGSQRLELPIFGRFLGQLAASALFLVLFLAWWWTRRGVPRRTRAAATGILVLGWLIVGIFAHPSMGGASTLMGPLGGVLTIWAAALALGRRVFPARGQAVLLLVIALAWVPYLLLRVDDLTGALQGRLRPRWAPVPEQAFLQERAARGPAAPPAPAGPSVVLVPGDWPAYRGPGRDGVVRGETVATDWKDRPPKLVWRKRVGPAWSSFAVVGGRLFTQEQRGEDEAVVCYDAATGEELWCRLDPARFYEPVAGAGPRATPALADGRLFALGARGLLNGLDATTGERLWAQDVAALAESAVPMWGFSGSPLVLQDRVLVFAGGDKGRGLLAFRAATGEPLWQADVGDTSYASPQTALLRGVPQVLMLTNRGLVSVDPENGRVLWEHSVPLPAGSPRSVQPRTLGEGQVLVASEADLGTALLDVARDGDRWTVSPAWGTRKFRPSFNDFVLHQGHAYGFDGRLFGCLDAATGNVRWKEGRYGHGQVLLLQEPGLLLVLSETGEVILLRANPERSEELGRFQAIHGRTWNHPVLCHDRLYVRNAEEMACFDLAP